MSIVVARSEIKRDGRTVSRSALEEMRLMALARIHEGESPANVAASFGLHRAWAYKVLAKSQRGGGAVPFAASSAVSCAAKRSHPQLSPAQERRVFGLLNGKNPREYGHDTGLWTRQQVRELIDKEFDVQLSSAAAALLLGRLGLMPQKPLQRAYRRDAIAMTHWQQDTYPRIVRDAKRECAELYFWDESSFRGDAFCGRTWALKGQKPTFGISALRQNVHAASAVNTRGGFWSAIYCDGLNDELFLRLLRQMMKGRRRRMHLVLEPSLAHQSALVHDHVQSLKGKLTLHFLPATAPELDPYHWI